MKIRFFAVIAILAMCSMSSFANVVLNNGQIVNVLIDDNVSSKGKGSVTGTVLTDILNNQGDVMIKGGTPVLLKVEKTPKRGIGKPGEVVVKCVSLCAVDGQPILLNGIASAEGINKRGLALGVSLGVTFGTLGFGWIIGLPCLAIKGGDAVIEYGTVINARVVGYYNIDIQK
ncbi:MAG: hypothetical protein IKY54_01320 [Muribaculaceae bacterium]|nr:hypothetical protein [Muribaculaceae bacterium]